MTYFGVSVEQRGSDEWRFVYNNLRYVIILKDYPYRTHLVEEIASTTHDKCWKISVMPMTGLHSEFKKTIYSLHNRLCALEDGKA